MPKFQDMLTWQQADLLMQPAFIRLVDNFRKKLDECVWTGKYEDIEVWPEGTSDETKFRVKQLQAELESLPPEQTEEVEEALSRLPSPYPGYQLCLEHQGRHITVDLWELCYQICFQNYDAATGTSRVSDQADSQGVVVDTSLLDETGNVDWNRLDEKTQQLVDRIFGNLPG